MGRQRQTSQTAQPLSKDRIAELGKSVARGMLFHFTEHSVRSGAVDPMGKDELELECAVLKHILDTLDSEDYALVIDHTPSLLEKARAYRASGDSAYACMMYATWAEHWINGIISEELLRRAMPTKEIKQVFRKLDFEAKTTWFLRVLALPPIHSRHLRAFNELLEARNAFVHYKWSVWVKATEMPPRSEHATVTEGFETTVTYCKRYEDRIQFKNKRSKIRRLARKLQTSFDEVSKKTSTTPI